MASIGARRPSPTSGRVRRYTFAGLLLLTLLAPIGWVTATEQTAPYLVVFDPDAVAAAPTAADFDADPDATFQQRAMPAAARASQFSQTPATARGRAQRRVDGRRVINYVREIAARDRVRAESVYTSALGGFSASLTPRQVRALAADPAVGAIVPDVRVSLGEGAAARPHVAVHTTGDPAMRVPAGVKRVGARSPQVTAFTSRASRIDADVAVLDTGIERDHPDLNVVGGHNCTRGNPDRWDDTNGHGTHVAGIIGALDNRIGVVGVAPGVRLWSVKVLNSTGEGFMSWILCGIDWVTAQHDPRAPSRPLFEVANMSMAFSMPDLDDGNCGRTSRDAIHQAICRSVSAGTVYVVAAGNDSNNARRYRPAAYDEVITVSALADYDGRGGGRGEPSDSCPFWSPEHDDSFTAFSNYGPDVDLIAPGKCVLSTFMGKRYAWMSGTSMAAPHVSGAAAIYRAMYPRATPAQVRQALEAVGTLDWRTSTDPDGGPPEKAVWIGQFRAMAGFSIDVARADDQVAVGGRLVIDVDISSVGGFDEPITLDLVDPPSGFSADRATVRQRNGLLVVQVAQHTRPGHYSLTVVARSDDVEQRATVEVSVSRSAPPTRLTGDRTAPRAPSVSIASSDGEVYIGNAGMLWVRGGSAGSLVMQVESRDPESGIAAYVASVDGAGWSVAWLGDPTDGRLRLEYAATGQPGRLLLSAANGAGVEGAATVGRLMRDSDRPSPVEWTSLDPGTTRQADAAQFRLNWRGGSDSSSGLADRLIVGRYRAPLRRDGSFNANGFTQDGDLRRLADGATETDLEPGYCYIWAVRTVDNVGNAAESVVSGYLIVDRLPR